MVNGNIIGKRLEPKDERKLLENIGFTKGTYAFNYKKTYTGDFILNLQENCVDIYIEGKDGFKKKLKF